MDVEAREAVGMEARSSGPRWMAVSCVRVHLDSLPGTTFLLGGPLEEQQPRWPGKSEGIIPAGTPVTLLNVGFPGARELLHRPIGTPREAVWVTVQLPGGTLAVLPLPDTARSEAEFWGQLGQWVTRFDPLAPDRRLERRGGRGRPDPAAGGGDARLRRRRRLGTPAAQGGSVRGGGPARVLGLARTRAQRGVARWPAGRGARARRYRNRPLKRPLRLVRSDSRASPGRPRRGSSPTITGQ